MNIQKIMDRVLFALSVPKCVCCGERLNYGRNAFCPKCSTEFEEFKTRNCSRCARILSECDCSNEYLKAHFIRRVVKCCRYLSRNDKSPANALIYSLKRDNREDVLSFAADQLLFALNNSVSNLGECIVTNIPRRKSAIVEFGIDHSELLAREIARRSGARYLRIFRSNAKKPQKSLETSDRRKNADFAVVNKTDMTGKRVIIVDDIITSGASMSNAAALIRAMGCRDITAVALAIAYRDT